MSRWEKQIGARSRRSLCGLRGASFGGLWFSPTWGFTGLHTAQWGLVIKDAF